MAKGKTFTYVLIACVAAVWGLIIYRVFAGMSEDDAQAPVAVLAKVPYFKMVDHQYDAVKLELGYRDPFSAAAGYEEISEPKNEGPAHDLVRPVQPVRPTVQKPQVNWSNVQYMGYINNPDGKQKMVLVAVNGSSAVLKEGQSAHGLKLVKHLGDSLKVLFQGETKFIKIK